MRNQPHDRRTPMPIAAIGNVDQVQAIERKLIDEWGFPALTLMERAALAVTQFIEAKYPSAPVLVLAGTGNNAADGMAVARQLLDRGRAVRMLTVGSSLGEMASKQMSWLMRRGLQSKQLSGSETFGPEWVLVDAVFGIGLNRSLKSDAMLALEWANRGHWRGVVAIDAPSGLNANTGEPMGGAIRADHTITFGVLKTGLVADQALVKTGQVWLADIGFPPGLLEPLPGRLNMPTPLPEVLPNAHKGTMGTVLIVAGSATMTGAAILCARAACRTGIGLAYLAVPAAQRDIVALAVPEAIVLPLPESEGSIGPEALAVLMPHLARLKALAIGPGIGHTPRTVALVEKLLEAYQGPIVLDADALPRGEKRYAPRQAPLIMTPHAGELARMFGKESDEVQRDRLQFALEGARVQRAIMVYKGARTIIARPEGTYAVNATGNRLLATAGSGDVLTGLILGLLGRGLGAYEAACTGVYTHGRAAEVAHEAGMVSLMANDVAERIPYVLGMPPRTGESVGDLIHVP